MRQRVMIAIGLACNPKLIIADEPTTALDVTIQAQILELMKDLSRRLDIALIIITHNLGVVARYADRVNVMYAARIVEQGTADDVFLDPRHPYTIGLLRSVPRLDRPRGEQARNHRGAAAGSAQRRRPAAGSRRAARYRIEVCAQDPALRESRPGAIRACSRAEEIAAGTLGSRRCSRGRALHAIDARDRASRCSSVDDLHKYFEVKAAGAGFLSSKTATVKAVEDVSFTIAAGRDARPRRRIRLRQDHGRPADPAARGADRRRRSRSAASTSPHARDAEMRGVRRKIQVIFQDPYSSLNPRMTVGQIIGEPLSVYRLVADRKAAHERVAATARPGRPAPLHGGALSARAVGRPAPARRHRARARDGAALHRLRRAGLGARRLDPGPDHQPARGPAARGSVSAYLFIAHDLAVVRHISDRVAVMYLGRIMEVADRDELYASPLHPYTKALLDAAPIPDPTVEKARAPRAAQGRIALALDAAVGLRLPYPLSDCGRGMPPRDRPPLARRIAAGTFRRPASKCEMQRMHEGDGNGTRQTAMEETHANTRCLGFVAAARLRIGRRRDGRRATAEARRHAATSRSAPRRRTTIRTAATPTRRCISRRRSIRRCCASTSTSSPRSKATSRNPGRSRPT